MHFPIQFRIEDKITPYCNELLGKTWHLEDLDDARRLYEIRCLQALIGVDKESFEYKYLMNSIENFEGLASLKDFFDEKEFYSKHTDLEQYYRGDIITKDIGSKKTIVVVNHRGHWAYNLYNKTSMENYRHPEFYYLSKQDQFNYISFYEDETRSYLNPMLEPSGLYRGINSEIDSIQKVSDFVKKLYPNTDYYVVSDCKTGHSACILAEHLQANKVFLASPVTYLDADKLWDYVEIDNKVNTTGLMDINFIMYIRAVLYKNTMQSHQYNINDIAKHNPNIDFNVNAVNGDFLIRTHIENVDTTIPNLSLNLVENNQWIKNKHHMLGWVRKQKMVMRHFCS